MELKGEVIRTLRPTKARTSWIPQETWWLADRRAALQQSHRASTQEARQALQKFQRSLQDNRQIRVREAGDSIEALLTADQNQ